MKAFIVDRYGKSGQGRIGEVPEPQLRENDVRTPGLNSLVNDPHVHPSERELR